MKKAIILTTLFAILMLTCCSCMDIDSIQDQGNENTAPTPAETTSNSALGDYDVVIESCRLVNDYKGNPAIIVTYQFTNNSVKAAAFYLSLKCDVFQDGIGLNRCYLVDDSVNYSSDNMTKEIKPGATLSVEVAYELNDNTTDIEVEVSELISFSNKKVTKTFSIS